MLKIFQVTTLLAVLISISACMSDGVVRFPDPRYSFSGEGSSIQAIYFDPLNRGTDSKLGKRIIGNCVIGYWWNSNYIGALQIKIAETIPMDRRSGLSNLQTNIWIVNCKSSMVSGPFLIKEMVNESSRLGLSTNNFRWVGLPY